MREKESQHKSLLPEHLEIANIFVSHLARGANNMEPLEPQEKKFAIQLVTQATSSFWTTGFSLNAAEMKLIKSIGVLKRNGWTQQDIAPALRLL